MVAGLRSWARSPLRRDESLGRVEHDGWSVEARRAPLGVVGFVFEGRPNVFADATGVLRTGNTVVMRIGSDALGTASAIVTAALDPALAAAGLPAGTVVARPIAGAFRRLGAVRRSAGCRSPSLAARVPRCPARRGGPPGRHAGQPARHRRGVARRRRAGRRRALPRRRGALPRPQGVQHAERVLHPGRARRPRRRVPRAPSTTPPSGAARAPGCTSRRRRDRLSRRSASARRSRSGGRTVNTSSRRRRRSPPTSSGGSGSGSTRPRSRSSSRADVDAAVALCNRHSPRFVASLVSDDPAEHDRFYAAVDAPFVGDGFTRWVDGQYALDTPGARPLQLAGRTAARPRRRALGRLGAHRPLPRPRRRPRAAALMRRRSRRRRRSWRACSRRAPRRACAPIRPRPASTTRAGDRGDRATPSHDTAGDDRAAVEPAGATRRRRRPSPDERGSVDEQSAIRCSRSSAPPTSTSQSYDVRLAYDPDDRLLDGTVTISAAGRPPARRAGPRRHRRVRRRRHGRRPRRRRSSRRTPSCSSIRRQRSGPPARSSSP